MTYRALPTAPLDGESYSFSVRFSGYITTVGYNDDDERIMLVERGTSRVVAACTSYGAAEAVDRLLNGWCAP